MSTAGTSSYLHCAFAPRTQHAKRPTLIDCSTFWVLTTAKPPLFGTTTLMTVKIIRKPQKNLRGPKGKKRHTTAGIRWSSPIQLLICRLQVYQWEIKRDPEFPCSYGRMYHESSKCNIYADLESLLQESLIPRRLWVWRHERHSFCLPGRNRRPRDCSNSQCVSWSCGTKM